MRKAAAKCVGASLVEYVLMLRGGGCAGKQQRAEDQGQKAPDHPVNLARGNNAISICIKTHQPLPNARQPTRQAVHFDAQPVSDQLEN